ncbi:hypothetical protein AF335_04190 [Streptomyces eurocidicus]|uniref:DUF397 domain-containing protein n=1 Tax=Streptomyces eurocidicus TaxID=66423 RepID=A0A2N8P3C8_STREU|nr:DUF397 domain-containing protein [Streptomyces eurocidicus]MBB5117725.1 hypothetical protein [Streptomyces eurocidicus]MBF6053559.1 DUF397 domain-containing protein [Streptomyces eurocidicus]PNE35519.1 hypothetical protein AF335_04190 [Streptomyces eurocidicus]
MIVHNLPHLRWRKSSYSIDEGDNCVEAQLFTNDLVAVGDSKERTRGAFIFTPHAWTTFIHSIRTGSLEP